MAAVVDPGPSWFLHPHPPHPADTQQDGAPRGGGHPHLARAIFGLCVVFLCRPHFVIMRLMPFFIFYAS